MFKTVQCLKVDGAGLPICTNGQPQTLEVDTIIVCQGQIPLQILYDELLHGSMPVHLIGGTHEAAELDAKRTIKQASYLAAEI
jgi:2,4-dienoyl-CoA reductase (NADPH2)